MEVRHNVTCDDFPCNTIFFPGMSCALNTQLLKYIGNNEITATTGEIMSCTGRNGLQPINIIHNPYIVRDIPDVNLQPFNSFFSCLNPINWGFALKSYISNWMYGYVFEPANNPGPESVVYHATHVSKINIGQNSDIEAHNDIYESWRRYPDKQENLVLKGVSRGTSPTFCGYAKYKYQNVKVVILEGAVDSIDNVLLQRMENVFGPGKLADWAHSALNFMFTTFTEYNPDGISPLKMVDEYPEHTPTIFISSRIDKEVPLVNTQRLCHRLAAKNKNPVYLLVLENSSHPNYAFDDAQDRETYETFIENIYQKHVLNNDDYNVNLILQPCLVNAENVVTYTIQNSKDAIDTYLQSLLSMLVNDDKIYGLRFFKNMVSFNTATKHAAANKLMDAVGGKSVVFSRDEYAALREGRLGKVFRKIKTERPNLIDNIKQVEIKQAESKPATISDMFHARSLYL